MSNEVSLANPPVKLVISTKRQHRCFTIAEAISASLQDPNIYTAELTLKLSASDTTSLGAIERVVKEVTRQAMGAERKINEIQR